MRLAQALVAAAALPALVAADCNANNCLRQIRASRLPERDGLGDCQSFFRATVTPATSTFYETVTATATITNEETTTQTIVETATNVITNTDTVTITQPVTTGTLLARQVTVVPSLIPAYASGCSSLAAYSSACSCVGATPTTITAAAPSTTITQTVTSDLVTTETETATTFTTATISTTESQTITATVPGATTVLTYSRKYGPTSKCTYNHYFEYREISSSNAPDGTYGNAIAECRGRCDLNTRCKTFHYEVFPWAAFCILDDEPYQSNYMQCGYVTEFFVLYEKN